MKYLKLISFRFHSHVVLFVYRVLRIFLLLNLFLEKLKISSGVTEICLEELGSEGRISEHLVKRFGVIREISRGCWKHPAVLPLGPQLD